ncbi:MAG: hypothetical protein NTU60_02980, partial [Candidatus Aminicenantes bacterium]|nr:hypothetical protein [Candidatus Aminicenantes bacterium]
MTKRRVLILIAALAVVAGVVVAQYTPWLYWTFLPKEQIDEIVGEASGETALNTIIDINGYNRDRQSDEYAGLFQETQVILKKLKQYGISAELVEFPAANELWDA